MPKKRLIDTSFWSDTFIRQLNAKEKLIFLYLLTNQYTNCAGIYELSPRVIEQEIGLLWEQINPAFEALKDKIIYFNGYIIIKNFWKHQAYDNPWYNRGVIKIIKNLPPEIRKRAIEAGFPVGRFRFDQMDVVNITKARDHQRNTGFKKFREIMLDQLQ